MTHSTATEAALPAASRVVPAPTPHYHFLDAARGVGALGVLFYHVGCCHAFSPLMWRAFPRLFGVAALAAHGVQIFFLLSGFVITYSMCRLDAVGAIARRPLPLFLARRWVRLTPPYWGGCALALAILVVEARLTKDLTLPGARAVALNFGYLQPFFGVNNLFTPAWSLCVEAQFYCLFAALLWGCYRAGGSVKFFYRAILISGIISVLWPWTLGASPLFFEHWCHFAAGALIYLSVGRLAFRLPTLLFLLSFGGASLAHYLGGEVAGDSPTFAFLSSGLFGLMVWTLAERKLLYSLGSGRVWQWLGTISYSLYLVHFQIGIFGMKAAFKVLPHHPLMGWMAFATICALCIGIAQLFHLALERPAVRWSNRFKLAALARAA